MGCARRAGDRRPAVPGQRRRVLRRARHGGRKLRGADRCRGRRPARVTDRAGANRPVTVPGRGPALSFHPRPRGLPRALLLRDDAGGRGARTAHRVPLTGPLARLAAGARAGSASESARLTAARLALAFGPGPDQPARVAARLQPVTEVLAGDLLEKLDVLLESGDQRLALLPRQGLPRWAVPLQDPFQRFGDRARARQKVAHRYA